MVKTHLRERGIFYFSIYCNYKYQNIHTTQKNVKYSNYRIYIKLQINFVDS